MCRLLKPAAIKVLAGKKRDEALAADAAMQDARSVCTTLKLPLWKCIKYVGRLDVRLCTFLLDQQGILETRKYGSINEIAEVFFDVKKT